jgi:hypothetical protein
VSEQGKMREEIESDASGQTTWECSSSNLSARQKKKKIHAIANFVHELGLTVVGASKLF